MHDVADSFKANVIPRLKGTCQKPLVLALLKVIEGDETISGDMNVGIEDGYQKAKLLNAQFFTFEEFLANVFVYTVKDVRNTDCKKDIKEIGKDYLKQLSSEAARIQFEDSVISHATPLEKTILDNGFDDTFELISEADAGLPDRPSSVRIYSLAIQNDFFRTRELKELVLKNLGRYVFSRARCNNYAANQMTEGLVTMAMGSLKNDPKVASEGVGSVFGEIFVYSFLEHVLQAPKVMSRIEFSSVSGARAVRSEGVHLALTGDESRPFTQLVFGASEVLGDIDSAIDKAFERVIDILNNSSDELQTVEAAISNNIFDPDTTDYLIGLLKPSRKNRKPAEQAFGIFLGYSVNIDDEAFLGMSREDAIAQQVKTDAVHAQSRIRKLIIELNLQGHSFYVYVLPLNDAPSDKEEIMNDVFEGRVF